MKKLIPLLFILASSAEAKTFSNLAIVEIEHVTEEYPMRDCAIDILGRPRCKFMYKYKIKNLKNLCGLHYEIDQVVEIPYKLGEWKRINSCHDHFPPTSNCTNGGELIFVHDRHAVIYEHEDLGTINAGIESLIDYDCEENLAE